MRLCLFEQSGTNKERFGINHAPKSLPWSLRSSNAHAYRSECTALQRTVPHTPTRTTCLALLLKIADARSERSGPTRDVTASWSRRPRLNNAIRQPPVGAYIQPALCRAL